MAKKKLKKKYRIIIKLFIFILVILLLYKPVLKSYNYIKEYIEKQNKIKELVNYGYDEETSIIFVENEINSLILKVNYSKYLDDSFNEEKYTLNDINEIKEYIKTPYFKVDYLERYINYQKEKNVKKNKAIIDVNIGLDNEYYTNIRDITNADDTLVLINKYNKLPSDYKYDDLVTLGTHYTWSYEKLRKVAADALMDLMDDAEKEGYALWAISGYRTEEYQSELYNEYKNSKGVTYADAYSARPGHSEHQTGLAVDIAANEGLDSFESTKAYKWTKDNAYKYGFIERYKKGQEKVTGYDYEPWHYRYVGIEVATYIYENNITFEEYAVMFLNY